MFKRGKRRLRLTHVIVTLASGILLVALAGLVFGQSGPSPHDDQGTCSDCHLNDPKDAQAQGEKIVLTRDVDMLCTSRCHEMKPGMSHPSNIPASKKPPEELPLDWSGKITCSTCHYAHRRNRPDVTGYMIRTENMGRAFCEQCHSSLPGMGKHSSTFNRSHLGMDTSNKGFLDALSLECLGCHDGTVARGASAVLPGSSPSVGHRQIGLSHPIGVEYPPRTKTRSRYRPASQVDARIRFFDGKLGCCSCHEPYSEAKHGLAMPNDRSQLCLECHIR